MNPRLLLVALTFFVHPLSGGSGRTTGVDAIVLGDSISDSVRGALTEAAPRLILNARPARTLRRSVLTDNGSQWLPWLGPTGRKRWIIELGTNDAWMESLPIDSVHSDVILFARQLDRVLPSGACVTWVLPFIGKPVKSTIRDRSKAVDQFITAEVDKRPCWKSLDWPRIAVDNPNYVARDGVHLSAVGKLAFTQLLLTTMNGPSRQPAAR